MVWKVWNLLYSRGPYDYMKLQLNAIKLKEYLVFSEVAKMLLHYYLPESSKFRAELDIEVF